MSIDNTKIYKNTPYIEIMFIHNINPVLLKIGSLEVRYYGIIYMFGFVILYFFLKRLSKEKNIVLKKDDLESFVFYTAVSVIISARLFYVVFYNLKYYLSNLFEIFAVWHGGMSFHGGLVGAFIANYLFSKKKNLNFLKIADITAIAASLALFFGRIGNFINGELYGKITNLPWAVKFQGAEGFRHPSQLYEALKNLFIFIFLFKYKNKEKPDGFLFAIFLILYSILRSFIEFFREPEIFVGSLTMGQLLNIPLFIAGLYILRKIKII